MAGVRKEIIGDCTLYLGDCREVLPALAVDHVMSDPPYEDELHKAMGRIQRADGREMVQDLGEALGEADVLELLEVGSGAEVPVSPGQHDDARALGHG